MRNDPRLLCVNSVYRSSIREVAAKVDHALGKANLPQPLVTLLLGDAICRPRARAPPSAAGALRRNRGVVNDLIVNRLIRLAQRRIEQGEEAQLRGHNAARGGISSHKADAGWPNRSSEWTAMKLWKWA